MTWHAGDTLNLYANFGKGLETPTLAEVAYTSTGSTTTALFNPRLNASRSQHYETGAKWLPTPQSRLDVNLFRVASSDEIVVASSNFGRTAFKNAPGTNRRGVEISGKVLLHSPVQASVAGSWIDARFSQDYSNNTTAVKAGNKLPGIPDHYVFSELLWSSRSLDGLEPKGNQSSRAGIELINAGRIFANDVNTASADGYTTLNAKLSQGWAVGSATLTAYGRIDNLTNKRYVGSVIVNQAAGQFYEPAPGRTWSLGLQLTVQL